MSKILVTGAAGFVGSSWIRRCGQRGQDVVAVDRASYFSDRREHQGVNFGQIVDRDSLFDWLKSEKPKLSAIVHLGACANTMETDEAFLWRNNVEYSQKLWEYATSNRLPFVYASSAATYGAGIAGRSDAQAFDDDESLTPSLRPLNLYGNSKQLFDLWALEQDRKGSCPPSWAGFKFFNVYGFGERHKGTMASVILHAFDQIREKGELKLFKSHKTGVADGEQRRDFVFVDDVTSVLRFALDKPIARGIYNLGTGTARTYLDLARATFKAVKSPEKIVFIDTPLSIRDKYQYFTEARMDRLKSQGYATAFTSLEKGVSLYIEQLLSS